MVVELAMKVWLRSSSGALGRWRISAAVHAKPSACTGVRRTGCGWLGDGRTSENVSVQVASVLRLRAVVRRFGERRARRRELWTLKRPGGLLSRPRAPRAASRPTQRRFSSGQRGLGNLQPARRSLAPTPDPGASPLFFDKASRIAASQPWAPVRQVQHQRRCWDDGAGASSARQQPLVIRDVSAGGRRGSDIGRLSRWGSDASTADRRAKAAEGRGQRARDAVSCVGAGGSWGGSCGSCNSCNSCLAGIWSRCVAPSLATCRGDCH